MTNLPVGDFAIAIEKLEWYVLRWQAEVFHKVMKSGCRAGDARLETAEWLAKFLALIAMVSWCILFLTMSARAKSEVALRSITFGSKRSGPQMRILSCFGWVGSSMASEIFRIARHAANIFWRTTAPSVARHAPAAAGSHGCVRYPSRSPRLKAVRDNLRPYSPLFSVDTRNNDVLWELWIAGFGQAIALRPAAWKTLLDADDDTAAAMSGMLLLIDIAQGEKKMDNQDPIVAAPPDKIAGWVVVLNAWRLANTQAGLGRTKKCAAPSAPSARPRPSPAIATSLLSSR